jgi:hypothetical protein
MRRAVLLLVLFLLIPSTRAAEPLPGTKPLTRDGDLAAQGLRDFAYRPSETDFD